MSLSKSSAGCGNGSGRAAGTCFICKSAEDDELLYGKFIGKWKMQVHYYCLLLTSNLVQNGESDDEGIFGFLQEDIKAEVTRIKSQKCYVCKAPYANISCCAKKCFRTFHTVCGRRAGCLNHFVDTYQSWCDRHVEVEQEGRHGEEESCGICYEEMGAWERLESVRAPCCQNGWFHRRCVAQFAQSAGYFFKCPLCNNNTDQFKQAIQRRGVYIPEKDAAWELEPNAFGEQLERPSECDAEVCLCRYGRDYDTINGKWDLRLCETCGSTCRHDLCMAVPTKNYVCNFCRPIVGDEPPAAVLALAEESRRAEAARRRPSISSEASTSSSSTTRAQGRNRRRQNRLSSTSSSCTTSSSSSGIVMRKKSKHRPLTPSDSEPELSLPDLVANLPLRREAREKLLNCRAVILLQKLTPAQIQQLSQPTPPNSSSQSSVEFDFNYRASMNKQKRRKSIADLRFLRQVIRSDTDNLTTTTDVSGDNQEEEEGAVERPRTPTSRKSMTKEAAAGSFAKKFKLKIGAGGSAGSRKRSRIVSSSESDLEAVSAKKACPATAPPASKSKSRISLFPPEDDSENTCPNSPHKLTASIQVTITISENAENPSLATATIASPPLPPPLPATVVNPAETKSTPNSSTVKKCQTTLNSFFKKSPEESTATGGSGSGSSGSAISSSAERKKKQSGGAARKKLVELDRSQRNLLDFFNRC